MSNDRQRSRTPIIVAAVVVAAIVAGLAYVVLDRDRDVQPAPRGAVNLLAVDAGIRTCVEQTAAAEFCALGYERGPTTIFASSSGVRIDSFTAATTVRGVTYSVTTPVAYDGAGYDATGSPRLTCTPQGSGACDDDGSWTATPGDATVPSESAIAANVEDAIRIVEQVNEADVPSLDAVHLDLLAGASARQVAFLDEYVEAAAQARMAEPAAIEPEPEPETETGSSLLG